MDSHDQDRNVEKLIQELRTSLRNQNQEMKQAFLDMLKNNYQEVCKNHNIDTNGLELPSLTPSYSSYSSQAERIKNAASKEDCMREAIQQHITTIVETLPFFDSEVPDEIIQRGVATIDDAAELRLLRTRDDQVSGLVSYVIKRDLKRMEIFLDIVKQHNSAVVENIQKLYEDLILDNEVTGMPCVACELKRKCDIKWVYNYLFGRKMISTALHDMIVILQRPVGNQDKFWDELLQEVTHHPPSCVLNVMVEALKEHGNDNLIDMLQRLIRKSKHVHCMCVCSIPATGQQRRQPSTSRRKSVDHSYMGNNLTANTDPKEIITTDAIKNTDIIKDKRAVENNTKPSKKSTTEFHQVSGHYEYISFGKQFPPTSTGVFNTMGSDMSSKDVKDNVKNTGIVNVVRTVENDNAIDTECTKDCDQAPDDCETLWIVNQNSPTRTDNHLMIDMMTINDETKRPDESTLKSRVTSEDTSYKRATRETGTNKKIIRKKYDMEKMRKKWECERPVCNSDSDT